MLDDTVDFIVDEYGYFLFRDAKMNYIKDLEDKINKFSKRLDSIEAHMENRDIYGIEPAIDEFEMLKRQYNMMLPQLKALIKNSKPQ